VLCVEAQFFFTTQHKGLLVEGLEFGLVFRLEPQDRVLDLVFRIRFGSGLVLLLSSLK
jgi:hypothetical protein